MLHPGWGFSMKINTGQTGGVMHPGWGFSMKINTSQTGGVHVAPGVGFLHEDYIVFFNTLHQDRTEGVST